MKKKYIKHNIYVCVSIVQCSELYKLAYFLVKFKIGISYLYLVIPLFALIPHLLFVQFYFFHYLPLHTLILINISVITVK